MHTMKDLQRMKASDVYVAHAHQMLTDGCYTSYEAMLIDLACALAKERQRLLKELVEAESKRLSQIIQRAE